MGLELRIRDPQACYPPCIAVFDVDDHHIASSRLLQYVNDLHGIRVCWNRAGNANIVGEGQRSTCCVDYADLNVTEVDLHSFDIENGASAGSEIQNYQYERD